MKELRPKAARVDVLEVQLQAEKDQATELRELLERAISRPRLWSGVSGGPSPPGCCLVPLDATLWNANLASLGGLPDALTIRRSCVSPRRCGARARRVFSEPPPAPNLDAIPEGANLFSNALLLTHPNP